MNIEDFDSWDRLRARIEGLEKSIADVDVPGARTARVLYRGHANSNWNLDTTLERAGRMHLSATDYFRIVKMARPEIEAYTGTKWNWPTTTKTKAWSQGGMPMNAGTMPGLDLICHLRHHGFPSPLLDWSASPYVAAFFASAEAMPNVPRMAVFAYLESTMKGWSADRPRIMQVGHYLRAPKRHFLQQSHYTVCVVARGETGVAYAPHSSVLEQPAKEDFLWKFTLPTSQRGAVLRWLDRVNINAYSLLGSEDGLMKTLSHRLVDNS